MKVAPKIATDEEMFVAKVAGYHCVPSYFLVYGIGILPVSRVARTGSGIIFYADASILIEDMKHLLPHGTYFEVIATSRETFEAWIIELGPDFTRTRL